MTVSRLASTSSLTRVEWIRVAAGCGHGRDGVQVRAAGEYAELAEEPLLALIEQLV